jgi:putative nucleotidyltransferase with HDIG domain
MNPEFHGWKAIPVIEKIGLHRLDTESFTGERGCSVDEILSEIEDIATPSHTGIRPAVKVETIWIDARQDRDSGSDALKRMKSFALGSDANVQSSYRTEQVRLAKQLVKEAMPDVRHIFDHARRYRDIPHNSAGGVVGKLTSRSSADAVALIGTEKLQDSQEGTPLHSLAVCASMIAFGRSLGLNEDVVKLLGFGGLLHDIGKMALPTKLLERSGPLNTAELMVIRTHPRLGHDMLRQIDGMPKAVLDVCLYHHERFDGSGYPHGLVGTEIPEVARIAAICDVYDALTSIRPYKNAWSADEATDIMLESSGQFDPVLLDAFLVWRARKGPI